MPSSLFMTRWEGTVRGRKAEALLPVVAMARTAWSVGRDQLSRGVSWAWGFFYLLFGKQMALIPDLQEPTDLISYKCNRKTGLGVLFLCFLTVKEGCGHDVAVEPVFCLVALLFHLFFLFFKLLWFQFWRRVLLCSLGCLQILHPPVTACWVLGWQVWDVCATIHSPASCFLGLWEWGSSSPTPILIVPWALVVSFITRALGAE